MAIGLPVCFATESAWDMFEYEESEPSGLAVV